MYRTELEPQQLNPRGVQRFRLLVVAVLAFSAGAASVAYRRQLAPFDSAAGAVTPAHATVPRPVAAANEGWRPPIPATRSDDHGRPEQVPSSALTATAMHGCVLAPVVPGASVYGAECRISTPVPSAIPGPWELYQISGAPRAPGTELPLAETYSGPWELYHCSCP